MDSEQGSLEQLEFKPSDPLAIDLLPVEAEPIEGGDFASNNPPPMNADGPDYEVYDPQLDPSLPKEQVEEKKEMKEKNIKIVHKMLDIPNYDNY